MSLFKYATIALSCLTLNCEKNQVEEPEPRTVLTADSFTADKGPASIPMSKPSPTVKTHVQAITLSYKPGALALNSSDQETFRRVLQHVKAQGKYSRIYIAVWPDTDDPRKIGRDDHSLVKNRFNIVKSTVRKELGKDVIYYDYDMTDRDNALARALDDSGEELESHFAKQDPQSPSAYDVAFFRNTGGKSKVVIIVKTKILPPKI